MAELGALVGVSAATVSRAIAGSPLVNTKTRDEILQLARDRVLCVLITDSGQVEQRLAMLEQPVDEETLATLRVRLNEIASGRTMAEAAEALSGEINATDPRHAAVLHTLAATIAEQARVQRQDRLVVAGAANLVRTEEDFAGSILAVIVVFLALAMYGTQLA